MADTQPRRDPLDLAQRVWNAIDRELASMPEAAKLHDVIVAVAVDTSAFPLGATGKVLKRTLRELVPRLVTALAEGQTAFPMFQCVIGHGAWLLPDTKRASAA